MLWAHLLLLRHADKAPRRSSSRVVLIEAGDCASIADAGRVGLLALRRIEGSDGAIRVAHKTVLDPSCVRVGTCDVASAVDADPMRKCGSAVLLQVRGQRRKGPWRLEQGKLAIRRHHKAARL